MRKSTVNKKKQAAEPAKLPVKATAFLAAYAITGTITGAAEAAKIGDRSHYLWMTKHPEYKEAFESARQAFCESLEGEARRRAYEGVDEPVFHQGELVGHKRRYSDTLLIFLMKGNMPDKYGDKVQNDNRHMVTQVDWDKLYGKPPGEDQIEKRLEQEERNGN